MVMFCEWFSLKITRTVFANLASKSVATVSGGLTSKPAATVPDGLTSKHAVTVSTSLASKSSMMVFSSLASKPVVIGSLVEPQNRGGGFPRLDLKTDSYDLVIWTSKSSQWFFGLDIKIKRASVCRLRHKTDGRATTWDTHRDLAA
jgi:hypothetical protein